MIAHFWLALFGTSEAATRALPALIGSVAIVALYLVADQLFGRQVGLISAFLLAISAFQIYYAQDLRYYSLVLLLTLLSFYAWIVALKQGGRKYFALYAAVSILMIFTHFFTIFVLLAQVLYFVLKRQCYRKTARAFLGCQAVILLTLTPVVARYIHAGINNTGAQFAWIPDPPWWRPLETLARYLLPDSMDWRAVILAIALLAAACVYARRRVKSRGAPVAPLVAPLPSDSALLVTLWLLCPIIAPFLVSKLVAPAYIDRYTMAAAPASYILLALLIVRARQWVHPLLVLLALMIAVAPGLAAYYNDMVNEQWREVAAYVQAATQPGDVIVFAPGEGGALQDTFDWYYRGDLPRCSISEQLRTAALIGQALANCLAGHDRFWLVLRGVVDENPVWSAPFCAFFVANHPGIAVLRQQQFTALTVYLMQAQNQRH